MSTKHAILGPFAWGTGSGYSIKTEFEKGGIGFIWELSYGSIYPRLEALCAEGYITPAEVKEGGRERTTYELTAKGWIELDRWMEQPTPFPVPVKDELLLKMLFWGAVKPEDRVGLIRHLQNRKAFIQGFIHRLDPAYDEMEDISTDEFHTMINSYAKYRMQAELAWIDETIARLEGPAKPPSRDPRGIFAGAPARRAAVRKESE